MKLLLVNDQGEAVACFERVEQYDVQNSNSVLALLDFLETLIATAKENGGAPSSKSSKGIGLTDGSSARIGPGDGG